MVPGHSDFVEKDLMTVSTETLTLNDDGAYKKKDWSLTEKLPTGAVNLTGWWQAWPQLGRLPDPRSDDALSDQYRIPLLIL